MGCTNQQDWQKANDIILLFINMIKLVLKVYYYRVILFLIVLSWLLLKCIFDVYSMFVFVYVFLGTEIWAQA